MAIYSAGWLSLTSEGVLLLFSFQRACRELPFIEIRRIRVKQVNFFFTSARSPSQEISPPIEVYIP